MVVNFEEEYCSIMNGDGIIIQIDREVALDLAKQIQDFYEDDFYEDDFEDYGM